MGISERSLKDSILMNIERGVLAATDHTYPRNINRILSTYPRTRGASTQDIMLSRTPFGHTKWVEAVERAGIIDAHSVRATMSGIRAPNLSGSVAEMLPNHHISKPAYIGRIRADGQYEVIWQSNGDIRGGAWSEYLPKHAREGHE
jgi:hypothetical protein